MLVPCTKQRKYLIQTCVPRHLFPSLWSHCKLINTKIIHISENITIGPRIRDSYCRFYTHTAYMKIFYNMLHFMLPFSFPNMRRRRNVMCVSLVVIFKVAMQRKKKSFFPFVLVHRTSISNMATFLETPCIFQIRCPHDNGERLSALRKPLLHCVRQLLPEILIVHAICNRVRHIYKNWV